MNRLSPPLDASLMVHLVGGLISVTWHSKHKENHMKAIVTKYHGPTNFKGSRITASDEDNNRITISYPHELSGEAVHLKAAEALCKKMGWTGQLTGGSLKNGYVFVFNTDPLACDWCGLSIIDVRRRADGGKRCDACEQQSKE